MPNRTAVPESVFCENCPEQIVQSSPQGNAPDELNARVSRTVPLSRNPGADP